MFGWLKRLTARLLPAPPEIGPDEEVVLLDVRTRAEYERSHARGAIHIPAGELESRWRELEPHADKRVIVYCLMGSRAQRAAGILEARGFERVENGFGLGTLRRAGIETERGAGGGQEG